MIACALGTGVLQADATHEVTFSVDRHYIRSSWDGTKATGRGACGDLWSMWSTILDQVGRIQSFSSSCLPGTL